MQQQEAHQVESVLLPEYSEGRMFFSPILGCTARCLYCYLRLRDYIKPRKNECSFENMMQKISNTQEFICGKQGTIISVGAWGDIFCGDNYITEHSIYFIKKILEIGNPVQIMSKFTLSIENVQSICKSIQYENQLLYSATITSITSSNILEPGAPSPIERLKTCKLFSENGVATNVLIKPYIPDFTKKDAEIIADLLVEYAIDYCVVGILYWDDQILSYMKNVIPQSSIKALHSIKNELDCAKEVKLESYTTDELNTFIEVLQSKGLKVFKKSSCVNSNILNRFNQSGYFQNSKASYCMDCGNCNI